jgi:hypothetical protein
VLGPKQLKSSGAVVHLDEYGMGRRAEFQLYENRFLRGRKVNCPGADFGGEREFVDRSA